jgi:hypothetical protein
MAIDKLRPLSPDVILDQYRYEGSALARFAHINWLIDQINAGATPAPTFQSVTDAGATTTDAITAASITTNNGVVKPYKAYVAQLEQSGNTAAPTIIATFENNLSGAIVWTRTGVGAYSGTLTGAFTANKTALFINMPPNEVGSGVTASFQRQDANVINLDIFEADGSTPNEGFKAIVEIRVYN